MAIFFSVQNLVALREIALRRCADRVNRMSELTGGRSNRSFTEEHILVCLSGSPTNAKIIRTAARMAGAFKGSFTAVFVETPDFASDSDENKERLRQNTRLAEQLGATIETVYGDDIAFQIAEFARLSGISKIVLGRSSTRRSFLGPPPLTERITRLSPNLDIYIIPDQNSRPYRAGARGSNRRILNTADLIKSVSVLAAATLICCIFD